MKIDIDEKKDTKKAVPKWPEEYMKVENLKSGIKERRFCFENPIRKYNN